MARKALVELIGDPSSLLRSFRQSSNGAQRLERDLKGLAVTAKQSAEAQVQAAVKRDARLRQEITAYRQLASAARKGSTEQVIAARKAAEAEGRLARSLGVTAREQRALASSAARTERQLGRATRGTLAGSGALRSMGRSLAFASAGFIGFAAAAQLLRSSVTAASDLTEEINKSNVVFRGSEKQVQAWSKTLLPAFGLTRTEALRTAATFGNMLVPMGFVRRRAAEMSENLVRLAGDMASFNNASPVDVLQALQAGLANQPRPLRRFGVFLDQARIAAEALSAGIVKANVNMGKVADAQTKVDIAQAKLAKARHDFGVRSTEAGDAELRLHSATRGLTSAFAGQVPKLTTAQRTMAIYRLILKDTADAHGDAARTGNEFAGQMRAVHAEAGNLEEQLGTLLLPTTLEYIRALTSWLGKSQNQKRLLRDVKEAVTIFTAALTGTVAVVKTLVSVARPFANIVGGWTRLFELAAGAFIISKFVKLARAMRLARTEMRLLTTTPWVVTVTVAVIGLNAAGKALAKKLGLQGRGFAGLGDDVAGGAGDLNPVNRGGVFVDPISGRPVPNQRAARDFARHHVRTNIPGSPEDIHPGIHSRDPQREKEAAKAVADAATSVANAAKNAARRRRRFQERLDATPVAAPLQLQIREARAEAINSSAGILAAARAIKAWVLKILSTLHGQRLISAYAILGQANDTIANAAKEAADKAKAQADAAKQKLAEARQKMQEAIENVRQQIGELFQGPILAPTEQQTKARLGAPGPKPQDLVRDLKAQTAQFARFNRDLVQLQKQGAPKELIKELRAQGVSALPEIEALLGASKKIRDEFFKAFRSRERLVQRVAKVEMRAQNVVLHARNLHVSGQRMGQMARTVPTGSSAAKQSQSVGESAQVGGGGTVPIYNEIRIADEPLIRVVTRGQQRKRSTTAAQVRGRFPGRTELD